MASWTALTRPWSDWTQSTVHGPTQRYLESFSDQEMDFGSSYVLVYPPPCQPERVDTRRVSEVAYISAPRRETTSDIMQVFFFSVETNSFLFSLLCVSSCIRFAEPRPENIFILLQATLEGA